MPHWTGKWESDSEFFDTDPSNQKNKMRPECSDASGTSRDDQPDAHKRMLVQADDQPDAHKRILVRALNN